MRFSIQEAKNELKKTQNTLQKTGYFNLSGLKLPKNLVHRVPPHLLQIPHSDVFEWR